MNAVDPAAVIAAANAMMADYKRTRQRQDWYFPCQEPQVTVRVECERQEAVKLTITGLAKQLNRSTEYAILSGLRNLGLTHQSIHATKHTVLGPTKKTKIKHSWQIFAATS